MPKRFLPSLLEKWGKPHLSQQNEQSNQNLYSSGPNLALQEELPLENISLVRIVKLCELTSFIIVLTFGVMLVAYSILNLKLASQRALINTLANEVGHYTDIRRQALEYDSKKKFYDKTLSSRFLIGDKAKIVFSALSSEFDVSNLAIYPDRFSITYEVANPFDFARLINTYLSTNKISQISLQSASLVSSKHVFRVTMEGTFK